MLNVIYTLFSPKCFQVPENTNIKDISRKIKVFFLIFTLKEFEKVEERNLILYSNGKMLPSTSIIKDNIFINVCIKVLGGKGGYN